MSQATIRSAVGFGASVMIEEALRRAGAAEDIDEMLAEILVHYEAKIAAEEQALSRRGCFARGAGDVRGKA